MKLFCIYDSCVQADGSVRGNAFKTVELTQSECHLLVDILHDHDKDPGVRELIEKFRVRQ